MLSFSRFELFLYFVLTFECLRGCSVMQLEKCFMLKQFYVLLLNASLHLFNVESDFNTVLLFAFVKTSVILYQLLCKLYTLTGLCHQGGVSAKHQPLLFYSLFLCPCFSSCLLKYKALLSLATSMASYAVVIVPLRNSPTSLDALRFFLWVSLFFLVCLFVMFCFLVMLLVEVI